MSRGPEGFDPARMIESLDSILEHKRRACLIHPLFGERCKIGVGVSCTLHVYDEGERGYSYLRAIDLPMQVPPATRAAFPVEGLDECCVVITPLCLEDPDGYASVLHEMVHCHQSRTVEDSLKEDLQVYRKARDSRNHMWELEHPFPYAGRAFGKLVREISVIDLETARERMSKLCSILSRPDGEYLVWQIWKEGFARYIENLVRKSSGLAENLAGAADDALCRVSIYYLGDMIWRRLLARDTALATDLRGAFELMMTWLD